MEETKKNKTVISQKAKLIIILAAEFVAISIILLLIFFAGKKTHTVTFDLNGGILISGDVEQRVTQGQNASPPSVAKYGHYLMGWSGSYKSVTRDVTVKAIWEYETSPGIEYYFPENTNYCEISGSFKEIQGEVYIGSYYNERQVMGIQAEAFKDRTGITGVYLLDGILAIEDMAFAGCTSLEVIDIPSTVVRIGKGAFAGCENLKTLVLPESLKIIEDGAFEGCSSIESIVFPQKLQSIGDCAFKDCAALLSVEFYYPIENKDEKAAEEETKTDEKTDETPEILPAVLTSIGTQAFFGCEALTEVTIPESVIKIGKEAFSAYNMTINLFISFEELPEGYEKGWYEESAKLVFNYLPVEEDSEAETDNDSKDKGNGLWGSNS